MMKNKIAACMLLLISLLSVSAAADSFTGSRTDFRDETIYFAMTTRFYDGDQTNNVLCWDNQAAQIADKDPCWRGDFRGLIDKLDYIKALGFTAIWITPVVQNASGYDYHGYHAQDFSRVDLRYESRKAWGADEDVTFQSLIDAAHAKGLKVILDVVFNHTGNFGENHFCKLFERNQNIRNQATPQTSMTPVAALGGESYWEKSGSQQYQQRLAMMKNTDGQNHDTHNYWHHWGSNWNWDEYNRWWGQIAGDCVDLNTENPAVTNYLIDCYGEFIKMGVDGFRIDTSGHISRLSFNQALIPQLAALGEQYKSKRLNQCPFYMFGEVCARYSEVTYRGHPNLSPYYYTWKSDASIASQWNNDASWWDDKEIYESTAETGNMALCRQEADVTRSSDNALLLNGSYHTPDHSQASGFNVIDFPMHYNFTSAASAINIAKSGDQYYNDATYNVVYVDSHDYGPQPNDGIRFNKGTQQWAENLSLMFTFRGIPCLYYGSEVEFQAGKPIDKGTEIPLSQTGRAYFGEYLEGTVTTTDFGAYSASGNVAQTLNSDLAQHIRRLNLIRQAVPALRKGQYTFDGCSANGGYAFKRATADSYALVAINGGATFTNVPSGTYTDVVTGQTFSGTTITVSAPTNKGQLRVLVKDWTGGIIGEDGKFIYASSPVSKGSTPSFTDRGATMWYGPDDAIASASVTLSPNGGTFTTPTLTVTASLSETATTGWYQVADGSRTTLTKGTSMVFSIGEGVGYGQTVTISWGATDEEGNEHNGSATYTKVDPNAVVHAYFINTPDWTIVKCWAWDSSNNYTGGSWPGVNCTKLTQTGDNGEEIWEWTYDGSLTTMPTQIIFTNGGNGENQTADLPFENGAFYNKNGKTTMPDSFTGITHLPSTDPSRQSTTIYDLTGRPLPTHSPLPKGIYIVNGRKVLSF